MRQLHVSKMSQIERLSFLVKLQPNVFKHVFAKIKLAQTLYYLDVRID